MTHRYRRTAAAFLAAGSMCTLAACGTSSSSSGSAGSGFRPGGLKLTASEQTCLKKHGVTLPSAGAPGRRPAGAQAPNGRPPSGTRTGAPPKGFRHPRGGRFATHTAAFKACGVKLPSGRGSARPSSTSTSAG